MPIYEYICKSCDSHFDLIRSFSESSSVQCPHCLNSDVEKQVSLSSFKLKGSGWYSTDYKKKPESKNSSTPKSEPQEAKSSDPVSTPSESKTSQAKEDKKN